MIQTPALAGSAPYGRATDINVVTPMFRANPVGRIQVKRFSTNDLSLSSSTTVEVNQSYYFSLDGMAGFGDFTALFDQYRIEKIICEAIPSTDTPNGVAMIVAPDYDDATAPTYAGLLQYSSAVRVPFGKQWTVVVNRPGVDVNAFATGSASRAGVNLRSPWLDCGATDIQHYGLKVSMPPTPSGVRTYNFQFSYVATFRAVR